MQKLKEDDNLLSFEEYKNIQLLFEKWWNWLLYVILTYTTTYISWLSIRNVKFDFATLGRRSGEKAGKIFKTILAFFFVLSQGIIFSADGIIASWLKTPFGQLCYSINKSKINNNKKEEVINSVTEVMENIREVIRKVGTTSIIKSFPLFSYSSLFPYLLDNEKHKDKLLNIFSDFDIKKFVVFEALFELALFIPIIYSMKRIFDIRKIIYEINYEKKINLLENKT